MNPDNDRHSPARKIPDIDSKLLSGCKAGDKGAYKELFDVYGAYMFTLAFRFHGNHFDAEDSVQEAFVAVCRGIGGFEGQARFSTWLYRVLLNTCISIKRKKRSMEETSDFTTETAHPQYDAESGDALLRDILEREIAALPGLQRAVFLLYACEGFTHPEIADALRIRVGTSKSAYHRARRTLQNRLQKHGIDTNGVET